MLKLWVLAVLLAALVGEGRAESLLEAKKKHHRHHHQHHKRNRTAPSATNLLDSNNTLGNASSPAGAVQSLAAGSKNKSSN